MKYRGIEQLKQTGHAVAPCCKLLKASSSGFYDWLKRDPSKNTRRDDELTGKILRMYTENKGCYGSPRIHRLLHLHGEEIGRNRVARLMRESGLNAGRTKAYRPRTTMSNPSQKKSPRVFRIESSTVRKANEVWASDLTYLPAGAGCAYLVVVLDIYTREIKGWNVSDSMERGKVEGLAEGRAEGHIEERRKNARSMFSKGFSAHDIQDVTGLSDEEMRTVRNGSH
ncbi:MAG: IS3 family transposase [Salinispira sp.]